MADSTVSKVGFARLLQIGLFAKPKDVKLYKKSYLLSLLWGYWIKLAVFSIKNSKSQKFLINNSRT
jgi:hypothetical protein